MAEDAFEERSVENNGQGVAIGKKNKKIAPAVLIGRRSPGREMGEAHIDCHIIRSHWKAFVHFGSSVKW
jgi:hypothetical protein